MRFKHFICFLIRYLLILIVLISIFYNMYKSFYKNQTYPKVAPPMPDAYPRSPPPLRIGSYKAFSSFSS